jgi:hypothetical protein
MTAFVGGGACQGRQMVYFQTKNPCLGKHWRVMQWKMLVYVMAIRSIFCPVALGMALKYILWSFGKFIPFWFIEPRKIWQPWSLLFERKPF